MRKFSILHYPIISIPYIPCFVTDRLIGLTFVNRSFFFPYLVIKSKQRKRHKVSWDRPKNLSSADFAELQYLSINGPWCARASNTSSFCALFRLFSRMPPDAGTALRPLASSGQTIRSFLSSTYSSPLQLPWHNTLYLPARSFREICENIIGP